MQFQQDWPKDKKNYSSFNFLAENLEKFRSTEHCGAPLDGSAIFLRRSSLGSTDWPKDKKLQLFQFFGGKLRKISFD